MTLITISRAPNPVFLFFFLFVFFFVHSNGFEQRGCIVQAFAVNCGSLRLRVLCARTDMFWVSQLYELRRGWLFVPSWPPLFLIYIAITFTSAQAMNSSAAFTGENWRRFERIQLDLDQFVLDSRSNHYTNWTGTHTR